MLLSVADFQSKEFGNHLGYKNFVTSCHCVCIVLRFPIILGVCAWLNMWLHACQCVCHVHRWSQVSVMCDDHYCHTPAPLPQLTLVMQMSLIASPRPSLLPNRLDDVHLLDLIKVMREGGRDGRMDGGAEEGDEEWGRKVEGGNGEKRMRKLAQE